MREILYKNLTGTDNLKRDLSMRELISRNGVMATIERRCIYFVREKLYLKDPSDLEELKDLTKPDDAWKKKHFHILRKRDSNTGEDRLCCKVAGTFYAVAGHYAFCIAYIHSFRMNVAMEPAIKEKT